MTLNSKDRQGAGGNIEAPLKNQSTVAGRKGFSRKKIGWIAAVIVLAALAVGIHYYRFAVGHESTDDAYIDGHIIPISPRVSGHVANVYVADNQKVIAGELLASLDTRDFQAKLDAARATLDAAEAVLRSRDIEVNLTTITTTAGLDEARAAATAAEAMVQNARALAAGAQSQQDETQAQVAVARAALQQAQAELKAVEAKYQQAAQDLERNRKLAKSNTITEQQLEHAETAERMAAADLAAAKSSVTTRQSMLQRAEASLKAAGDNIQQSQAQVSARQAQLEQAYARLNSARSAPVQVSQRSTQVDVSRADVEKARAQVEQASLNLSYTRIVAPADGYVTKKSVEPGAFVQVGQSLLAIVTPEVWVTANFKETQLTHIRPGQAVEVTVDAFPGMDLKGRVDSIQRGTGSRFSLLPPENATGNFVKVVQRVPVKILLEQPEEVSAHQLVPGMSVFPQIDIHAQPSAMAQDEGPQTAATRLATP